MKLTRLIWIGFLALFIVACAFFGIGERPVAIPTGALDPTLHVLETSLAQPPAAPGIVAESTLAPSPANPPTDTIPDTVPPTSSAAGCLVGTWQAVNIQDYVIAAIPPRMMEEYQPTYQNTSGAVYISFFNNGLVTIQAYKLALEFDIQSGIFRVGLVVALDGLSSGQYQADGVQVVTSRMTTTGLTASARAFEQDVIAPEQIIAALPLVQPPFDVASYQCDAQTLSLRLSAYPENIPALQFQRMP
jgi:hypothetical protein